jgi:hypothetical protein
MDKDERFSFLQEELKLLLQQANRHRKSSKNKAFLYKMLAVSFAAAITILLGLKVEGVVADIFRDIALGLGATITVLNAADAFFDHRFLWVRNTVLVAELETLNRDMKLYELHPKQGEDHEEALDEFGDRLKQIMEDFQQDWFKIRQSQRREGHKDR